MVMRVRDVLTPLRRTDLQRLCVKRELAISGTKEEMLKR